MAVYAGRKGVVYLSTTGSGAATNDGPAILMPVSSVSVVSNSLLLRRWRAKE